MATQLAYSPLPCHHFTRTRARRSCHVFWTYRHRDAPAQGFVGCYADAGTERRPISDALISFSGYPGPAAAAVALAVAVRFGREDAALAILGVVFLAMALRITNLWGALELILGIAVTFSVVAWLPFELNSLLVLLLAVLAIAGSLRSILEQRKWRRAGRIDSASGLGYDALGVSRRLHLPIGVVDVAWIFTWFVFAVGSTIAATGISLQR